VRTHIYVRILTYMCSIHVSSYYTCVLILLYMCPHTTIYVSSYYYICVLILLYICPPTTICVRILTYMCSIHVSSYFYICVQSSGAALCSALLKQYICVLILQYIYTCVLILVYSCAVVRGSTVFSLLVVRSFPPSTPATVVSASCGSGMRP
jgi:hypothetical protein